MRRSVAACTIIIVLAVCLSSIAQEPENTLRFNVVDVGDIFFAKANDGRLRITIINNATGLDAEQRFDPDQVFRHLLRTLTQEEPEWWARGKDIPSKVDFLSFSDWDRPSDQTPVYRPDSWDHSPSQIPIFRPYHAEGCLEQLQACNRYVTALEKALGISPETPQ